MNRHRREFTGLDWAAAIVMGLVLLGAVWAVVAAIFAAGEGL